MCEFRQTKEAEKNQVNAVLEGIRYFISLSYILYTIALQKTTQALTASATDNNNTELNTHA